MSERRSRRCLRGVVFAAMVVLLSLAPLVVRSPYHLHLLIMAGMNIVLSMTFVLMFRTGLISLAIAAFWGIGAYASTLLVMRGGISFWVAMPLSGAIVGGIAFLLGCLLVRNAGFAFLLLTSVVGMLAVTVFGNIRWLGGYQGIDAIPAPDPITIPWIGTLVFDSKPPFYYLMLFLLLFTIVVFSTMYRAWTGRAWIAIDLKPQLAAAVGVNVFRYRLLAFVIASVVAGYMGSFYAHYIGAVIPDAFDIFVTIYVHVYAILGGLLFPILGPAVGAVIMTLVPEFLRITKEMEPIITGFLIILIILFLPDGLMSLTGFRKGSPSAIGRAVQNLFRAGK
jgi:branched-chain amino acid transport system permease protein